jgi:hypothetical protein
VSGEISTVKPFAIACTLFIAAGLALALSVDAQGRDSTGGFFRASMNNDAFGPGPVNEWDDLRTFGLSASIPVAGQLGIAVL